MQIRCLKCMELYEDKFEVCSHCGHIKGNHIHEAYHLTPGTMLNNRYLIGYSVGFGGFGITYIAYDTVLGIKTAVKEFYPARLVNRAAGSSNVGVFSGDKQEEFNQLKERFLQEAQNMAKFSNEPDIVNVFDFFEANGTAYIIMEYIDGFLLKTFMRDNKPLSEEDALAIITPVLTALKKIHDTGIIHRDISPDNIFLLEGGGVKIFDFGAARFDSHENGQLTAAIVKAGYAPPEQYRSKSKQGFYTDIYAIGAILYEMLTGEKPIESSDRNVKDELKRPSKLGVKVSTHVEKSVMKALAVKPELRFQNVDQFRKALGNLAQVDYPEEELKKIQFRRKLLGGFAGAGMLVVTVAVALLLTVFKPDETIVDKYLDLESATIDVWLIEDENWQKKNNEKIISNFQEKYSKITVNYTGITTEEYNKRLKQGTNLPGLYPVFEDKLEVLEAQSANLDLLYRANSESMLYSSEYPATAMPTSYTADVIYVNTKAAAKDDIKLADIPEQYDSSAVQKDKKTYRLYNKENREKFKNSKITYLYGNTTNIIDIHDIVAGYNVTRPVEQDGTLVKQFHDYYGVNKQLTEDEQVGAMWFLYWLGAEYSSDLNYIQEDGNVPLCKTTFEEYINKYPDLDFLKNYN